MNNQTETYPMSTTMTKEELSMKLQRVAKEKEKLEKALDRACEFITKLDAVCSCDSDVKCPFERYDYNFLICGQLCEEKYAWKKHFLKEVEDD